MSIIKKRTANNISRKKLFHFLFKSYIKSAYCGISQIPENGKELRREYYNDMNNCCNNSKSNTQQYAEIPRRVFSRNIDTANKATRKSMTVTQPTDRKFGQNEEIGWGNKNNVNLVREPNKSFGVCIVGGKVNISKDTQITGIFIKNIIPSSPAERSNQIKIGDRILTVNGEDVRNATQEDTIRLIKSAGCSINLVLQSFDRNELEKSMNNNIGTEEKQETQPEKVEVKVEAKVEAEVEAKVEAKVEFKVEKATAEIDNKQEVISEGDSSSSDEEDEESIGKVITKAGYEIDRKSAGNIKRTKDEIDADDEKENEYGYTNKKIKKKYGVFGNIIRARIQRDNNKSMGLALAGHRNRNEMGCFVAGINPKGNAKSQDIKVGDEILEINGIFLHKICHLNASVIIKGIPGSILEFILLRKSAAEEIIAVKPVSNFPAAFDQFDQLYSCFKNVRNVTIQKVGTSLGIMIIEGKHSEVGQGIFISDIQENSNAEMAGIKIGEMILAVNKDLLIDCNYDAAASLLKRAEGIVTLTVCNPNKKEDSSVPNKEGEPVVAANEKLTVVKETKKPEAPVVPEVPVDPATATIAINKETTIDLNAGNKPLGIIVVKGDSSTVQVGASVIVIHQEGAVAKDNRLKIFDKITEIDGKKLSTETTEDDLKKIFQKIYSKVKMVIYRAEPIDVKEMEVDVTKKSGKDIGLGFAECKGTGIYVTEIVSGSVIDLDRRIIKGDIITHINGDDIRKLDFIDSSVVLRAAQPKITFKIIRPKGKK